MPFIPLDQLKPRFKRVGKIRLGAKGVSAKGNQYPKSISTFRFTSADKILLERIAAMYGGEVTDWQDHPGEYDLITASDEIFVEVLPGQGCSTAYEFWGKAGRIRKCDGASCEEVSASGEVVEVPCRCQSEITDEKQQCKFILRLDVKLAGTTGLGVWTMETGSIHAGTELPQLVELMQMSSPGALPLCILAIERREKREQGKDPKVFNVPCIRVREGMAQELRAKGGVSLQALLASEQAQALAFNSSTPILEAGAPQLPQASVVAVDTATGEVIESVATPATPKAPADPLDIEVKELLTGLGLFSKEFKAQADQFKAKCAAAGKDWRVAAIEAAKSGAVDFEGFGRHLDPPAKSDGVTTVTVPDEDIDPFEGI